MMVALLLYAYSQGVYSSRRIARGRAAADGLAAEIEAAGGHAAVITADLGREEQTAGLVAASIAAIGPLSILVNNASVFERDEWDSADRLSWDAL